MTVERPQAAVCLGDAERWLAARYLSLATAAFQRAEALGAEADRCSAGRWMSAMLGGNFEAAWRESDAIRQRGAPDPHRFWQGQPLADKRVIVRCLHGFGDAIQFLRYAPRLQQLAAHVVVEVPPRLLDLAPHLDGITDVITWGNAAPQSQPQWDLQIEVMELPYLFRTILSELPLSTRYLHLPPCDPLSRSSSSHLQVGLAWTSGSWNAARNLPPSLLQPLLSMANTEFWSLQGGPSPSSQEAVPSQMQESVRCRESILGLACTIAQLDLVITVDTLAAHLAGALGKPAWVLLQHEADWRWMHGRSDSPWYPSLRLFRQPAPNDWPTVIADVCSALAQHRKQGKAA